MLENCLDRKQRQVERWAFHLRFHRCRSYIYDMGRSQLPLVISVEDSRRVAGYANQGRLCYSLNNILERFDVSVLKLREIGLDVVVEIDLAIVVIETRFEIRIGNR